MIPDLTVQTVSGQLVSLMEPKPEQIHLGDIAHALSNLCRFTGHVKKFYSVAEHSIFVSQIVPAELALIGLLHDAPEAYLGDVATPIKELMRRHTGLSPYDLAAERLWQAICLRFGLIPEMLNEIKHADEVALATERRDLMPTYVTDEVSLARPHNGHLYLAPRVYVRATFVGRYAELTGDNTAAKFCTSI